MARSADARGLHYINTSDDTADVSAETELFVIGSDARIEEAGFLIVGTMDIAIPPRSSHTTGDIYVPAPEALEGVNYYAVTGHTHQFGTDATMMVAPSRAGEGMRLLTCIVRLERPPVGIWIRVRAPSWRVSFSCS